MKPVNIKSLLQAMTSLPEEVFDSYLSHYSIEIKKSELGDLGKFTQTIASVGASAQDLDEFYIGYKIPQIGKEFDLLRFGLNSIVNVELKSESTEQKIKAQLLRNKYYLSFIGRKIFSFAFVSTSGELHFLRDDGELETVEATKLLEAMRMQAPNVGLEPDALFNPSDFLVSPFNSTDKFLAGNYFLTHQQEEFRTKILESIETTRCAGFISITGSAGTGKTLLTFDIALQLYAAGKKVLIMHCGQLNQGHDALVQQGWKIKPIRDYRSHDIDTANVVIIDEAQRIYQSQLKDLVERVNLQRRVCIFSYDKMQTLSNWEAKTDIAGQIDALALIGTYKLSEKIRTNKEIASFIKLLFSNKATATAQSSKNITINYFNSTVDAKTYLNGLDTAGWKVLRFTPSRINNEHHQKYSDDSSTNAHQVIGQEFDNVAIAIDQFFTYDDQGDLAYSDKTYYAPTKMLFQNITRARRRLNLVIINNQEIMSRCLAILE